MDETYAAMREAIPRLRRYARVLVRNVDQADDLVQECLERALRHIDRWEPGTNMRAWLFTIMHRIYLNQMRRPRLSFLEDIDISESLQSVSGGQLDRVELRQVDTAFSKLSDEHKAVIALVAVDGLKYEEAAEVLGIALGTVRSRLSRARQALARNLDEAQGAEPEAERVHDRQAAAS